MAVNKVSLKNGEELINLTQDTVYPGAVVSGYSFHSADGEIRKGTLTNATEDNDGLMSAADKIKLDGLPQSIVNVNTTLYWTNRRNYTPQKGEIIVYSDHKSVQVNGKFRSEPGIKIGDGKAYVVDLPFVTSSLEEVLGTHASNAAIHITSREREFWNNKVSVSVDGDSLVFSTD